MAGIHNTLKQQLKEATDPLDVQWVIALALIDIAESLDAAFYDGWGDTERPD